MKRLQATVLGRVQGVGFRDYVLREGRALGVTGYVRNSDDGRSVEVVAEGEDAKLEALLHSLHAGPRFSRVERVDSQLTDATGGFARFSMEF